MIRCRPGILSSYLSIAAILAISSIVGPRTEAEGTSGAYGLTAGMSLEQVQQVAGSLQQLNPNTYLSGPLPGAHSDLESFALVVTTENGLCRVQATTAVIPDPGDGSTVREKFDRFFEILWGNHGEHQVISTLVADSSHQSPGDWMTALLEKERVLMTLWAHDSGSELSGELESVVLSARALKPTEGFINIDYTFSNWPGCQAHLEAQTPETSLPSKDALPTLPINDAAPSRSEESP